MLSGHGSARRRRGRNNRAARIAVPVAAVMALGLGGPASIRIGELPGHWYIDVKPQSHGPA